MRQAEEHDTEKHEVLKGIMFRNMVEIHTKCYGSTIYQVIDSMWGVKEGIREENL